MSEQETRRRSQAFRLTQLMRYFSSMKAGSPPLTPNDIEEREREVSKRERGDETKRKRSTRRLTVVDELNSFEEKLDEGFVVDCNQPIVSKVSRKKGRIKRK